MALQTGKCTNFGLCAKADTHEIQSIPENADFFCQECKRPLAPVGGPATGSRVRVGLIPMIALLLVVLVAVWFFARGRRPGPTTTSSSGTVSTSAGVAPATLRLSGSNTIGAQLAPDLVEAWLKSKGATDVHRTSDKKDETTVTGTPNGVQTSVAVKAHGSATAFSDLAAGACDIGMASRKIKGGEAAELQSKGMGDFTSNADERVLGLDGVAVIVNDANGTDSLSKEQVANIFSGADTKESWTIYARDNKSGTYDTFKDRVLGDRALKQEAKRFEDSRELASAVSRDRHGIGFVGLPYAVGVKTLAIAEKGATPLVPNTMTIRTEAYPLSRRLYLYLPDDAKPDAREFVRFALSTQGQDIVGKDGFIGQKVDILNDQSAENVPNAPKGYVALMPSADRLSVDFRFRTGSSQLDTKAVDDIKRVAAAMSSQYAGRGLMLVGFADSTGNPGANLKLSKDRANSVAAQMQRQGITPSYVTGFGQQLPVADNSTLEGREKNRRVEVWLHK